MHETEQQYLFCEYERVFDHIFVLRYVTYIIALKENCKIKQIADFPEEVSISHLTFISCMLQW